MNTRLKRTTNFPRYAASAFIILCTYSGILLANTPPTDIDPIQLYHNTDPESELMIIAHRAQWRTAPENSLLSTIKAIEDGATMIEIDIRKTKDGHLVLMHDSTINRTTNGSGRVSDMTLEQIKQYNLLEYQGGSTSVTDEKVPTLEEFLDTLDGRAMIDLDKAWGIRDDVIEVLREKDAVKYGIFKAGGSIKEVEAFMDKHPDINYLFDPDPSGDNSLDNWTRHFPTSFGMSFDTLGNERVEPDFLDEISKLARVEYLTLWYGQTPIPDNFSHLNPDAGWGMLLDSMHGKLIMTDNIRELNYYNEFRTLPHLAEYNTIVLAEEFDRDGFGKAYFDRTLENRDGAARPHEAVDMGDKNGAIVLERYLEGEWVNYTVDIPKSGLYKVSGRFATPNNNTVVNLEFNSEEFIQSQVINTSSWDNFFIQPIGEIYLSSGINKLKFSYLLNGNTYGANMHYLLFEPLNMLYDYEYPEGYGEYLRSDKVLASDGEVYFCKDREGQNNCNGPKIYYAPGKGSHWWHAWIKKPF